MNPFELLPDIPRYLTAIAEWSSVVIYCRIQNKRVDIKWSAKTIMFFIGQILLQLFAGLLPLDFWIIGMLINISWMFVTIYFLTSDSNNIRLFNLAKSFVLSELMASVSWLIYCVTLYNIDNNNILLEGASNLFIYTILLTIIYAIEQRNNLSSSFNVLTNKDVIIAGLMGVITFTISNIGFLLSSTTYDLGNSLSVFSLRMFVNFSGLCLLYIQEFLKLDNHRNREIDNMNRLFNSQYEQYKNYAKSTDYINRKAHDLKHQLNLILSEHDSFKRENYVSKMRESINNLDVRMDTGNAVLDTILTQKNQYCLQNNINFTSMANGELVSGIDAMDLSSLVGNALDNAIEYVEKLDDTDRRLITFKLTNKGNIVILRVENYFIDTLSPFEELPQTSKNDKESHGYGLKSIKHVAEKYNGNMSISVKDNWFTLNILIPM